MEKPKFEIGQVLEFSVYGFTVTGKFISQYEDIIEIETISDIVFDEGENQTINEIHLINQ